MTTRYNVYACPKCRRAILAPFTGWRPSCSCKAGRMSIVRKYPPVVVDRSAVKIKTIRVGDPVLAMGCEGVVSRIMRFEGKLLPHVLVGHIWFKWEDVKCLI